MEKIVVVKGKVTPEHKIRQSAYNVVAQIDEKKQVIRFAECEDCIASQGIGRMQSFGLKYRTLNLSYFHQFRWL